MNDEATVMHILAAKLGAAALTRTGRETYLL